MTERPAKERADELLAAMRFDEKVALALHDFDAVARLDIPPLRYTDGRLIAAVAAANPRTVVVLNTGGPVLMPWLDQVGAVVQAWHPGQQFGAAVAAVLFGDADPGGRLPVTFPATPGQGPITGPERYPGVGGDARYDEGVLVGYRWYDRHGQQPLFPFGHGLSYGEYEYGQPRIEQDEATGAVTVSLQVTNVGARAGAEVVQVYLAAPPAARQPARQLKGFAKVHLGPGATGAVALRLDRDELAAFDEGSGEWIVHQGRYQVLVGRSSRDLRARAEFEVAATTPVRS